MFSRRCKLLKGSFPNIFHFLHSQQDVVSVAAETAGSNTSDLLSSEGGAGALCEVNSAESSRTEERDVDLKDKSL